MESCKFCDRALPPGARQCPQCGASVDREDDTFASNADDPTQPELGDGDSFERQLLALLQSNGKIAAIKAYRERTGAGLKESKDAVEQLAARHGVASARSGCAGMLLLAALCAWSAAGGFVWL